MFQLCRSVHSLKIQSVCQHFFAFLKIRKLQLCSLNCFWYLQSISDLHPFSLINNLEQMAKCFTNQLSTRTGLIKPLTTHCKLSQQRYFSPSYISPYLSCTINCLATLTTSVKLVFRKRKNLIFRVLLTALPTLATSVKLVFRKRKNLIFRVLLTALPTLATLVKLVLR